MTNKVDTVIDQLTGAVVDLMENTPEEWTKPWAGRTGLAQCAAAPRMRGCSGGGHRPVDDELVEAPDLPSPVAG